jgi:protein-arginine kinase activator protein McsA
MKRNQRMIDSYNKHCSYLASLKGMTLKEYKNEWQHKFQTAQIARFEKGMQKAIKYEDYEQAALIRDFVNHLKKGNTPWSGQHINVHIKDFYRY